jgi:AcrR family transcriptional regulator
MPEKEEESIPSELTAKKPYHHGDLRQALIKATLELVDSTGPRGFSLAQVCRQAGVSTAAPYRHFEDKESLLAAVSESSFALFRQALLQARDAGAGSPIQTLRALAGAYLDFACNNQSRFRVMFSSGLPKSRFPDLYKSARSALDIVLETVSECQTLLPPESKRLDAYTLAVSLWSQCHGLASLLIDGYLKEISVEERIPELLDLLVDRYVGCEE